MLVFSPAISPETGRSRALDATGDRSASASWISKTNGEFQLSSSSLKRRSVSSFLFQDYTPLFVSLPQGTEAKREEMRQRLEKM